MASATWDHRDMRRSRFGLFLVASVAVCLAGAQTPPRKTVWDGVYTEAQAGRGLAAYGQSCAGCHALEADGKAPLVGDAFWKSFSQKTAGDLIEFISAYMPNGAPGSLSKSTYEDIAALLLKSNGFPAGKTAELNRNAAAEVEILPKDGSTELPSGALARVTGCLMRSGADWVVTHATTPVRAELRVAPGEDATRPLGAGTLPLKFVLTKLDPLADARVVVNGILIGAGGADGINVTTVDRVAAKCP